MVLGGAEAETAAEVAEEVVDQRLGLQSSSFIAERMRKADSTVSSRCFWPSMASSCVVLVV